ncbi:MAG: NAD(+) diphosphatase [Microbacteriaceae bacterium]|nr:NAD(+) diphosphatase [Microbacteriaceae bacterium]
MSFEFTARLPLSRHELDRDYLARGRPDLFAELWADDSTRVLLLHNGQALLADDGALALLSAAEAPEAEYLIYLGRSIGGVQTPFVAAKLSEAAAATLDPAARWGDLRALGASLGDRDAGLFTEALAMANWHDSHRFSPRSGKPTVPVQGGWVRKDEDDDHQLFPRTDAAIIVGVTDAADRILLGSNALWQNNRYSLLAGFVEPGESLEAAVVREVFEESGIRIAEPVYLGSQPWPFPASIMVGFRAIVDQTLESQLTPDGQEILDLRWFSREDLAASLDEIALPGPTSIARAILEDWFGGPIIDRRDW